MDKLTKINRWYFLFAVLLTAAFFLFLLIDSFIPAQGLAML